MAFSLSGFNQVSSGANTTAPTVFSYISSTDAIATVTASAYFNSLMQDLTNGVGRLKVNDVILIFASDDQMFARVTAVTTNVTVSELEVASIQAGSIVASDFNQTALGTITVASSGTYARIDQTSGDTTLTRCWRLACDGTAATTTGDLVPVYCAATLPDSGIAQAATTIAGGLFWTDIGASTTTGAGGSVYCASRHIMQVSSDLAGVSGKAASIGYFEAWNDATGGTLNAGITVLNNMQTGSKNIGAGLEVYSGSSAATFTYGLSLSNATLATGGLDIELVAGVGILSGAGAPSATAPQGTLYLRTNGTTTNDRAYINTDGATTWTALTTAA